MNDLEEFFIQSWIKFISIELRLSISLDETIVLVNKDTDPKEFMNIKFLCYFAQKNIDIIELSKKNNLLNYSNNHNNNNDFQKENFQSSSNRSFETPEEICLFFKKFENFCEYFFLENLDSQISNQMKSLFNDYKKNKKIFYKTETKKNLLSLYKIIFFIRFIEELTINLNTNQINFMDILQKYTNQNKNFFKITMKDPYLFNILIKIINSVIIF
jgi:hypothetical protein